MCGILVLCKLNVKFQDFLLCLYRQVLHFSVCYSSIIHLACNKLFPTVVQHVRTHLLFSCRLWVAWPPKCTETDVCRQFAKAVILVCFSYNLPLRFTDFVAFFFIVVLYQRVGRLSMYIDNITLRERDWKRGVCVTHSAFAWPIPRCRGTS